MYIYAYIHTCIYKYVHTVGGICKCSFRGRVSSYRGGGGSRYMPLPADLQVIQLNMYIYTYTRAHANLSKVFHILISFPSRK